MNKKELAALAGVAMLAWHALSLVSDAERYWQNLARYRSAPSLANFIKLLVAEGVLIRDLGWL